MDAERLKIITEEIELLLPENSDQSKEDLDKIIGFVIKKVINDIVSYTHLTRDDLPEELDTTIVGMALTVIAEIGILRAANGDDGDVKSISEGDTSVSFMTFQEAYKSISATNTITSDYRSILNNYRVAR
ncbi:head-tail connector protein [Lapidilactobacillus bayanensis]|uniref:hypothetical protein n=1 Tax=Lapidilactobacillus bayanensis TaxID=2485998 RepID=UPI000F78E415|nr:hypothetical protein [Lapidilactobacillus bayanensis]